MGLWHKDEKGAYISKLAAEEFLIPAEFSGMEFSDGIQQLAEIAIDQALEEATQERPLDREKLQQLLKLKQKQQKNL